jgi:hypothetical protein
VVSAQVSPSDRKPPDSVLEKLCGHKPGELFGGADTDIAEIIRYYADRSATASR